MKKRKKEWATTLHDGESFPVCRPSVLARMLGIGVETLTRWRKEGRGPPFIRETPRTVVYLRSSVQKWLESQEVTIQRVYHRRKARKHR